jgi:monofunctional biosynthetic peptidoglycan transglycosylase
MPGPVRGRLETSRPRRQERSISRFLRRLILTLVAAAAAWLIASVALLVVLRWVDPPFTIVHLQRRIESLWEDQPYQKRYQFVRLEHISRHLAHAVIAAEDGRFYLHRGIDWEEIEKVWKQELPKGRIRGVSTITQQLVKNLFLTTYPIRKPAEFLLAPAAERILSKHRILELYLNIVEWGRGIYGAEAAARHYYGISAARLNREQAARLAACLPAPRTRHPEKMDRMSAEILERMTRMGW